MSVTPELLETPRASRATRTRQGRLPVGAVISGVVLAVIVLSAIAPVLFTSIDPLATDTTQSLVPPNLAHPFGTDRLGRDMFSRVLHGGTISLAIGFAATVAALLVGTLIGLLSGLAPRGVDLVVMRGLEIVLALPELLVALVVIAVLGPGVTNLVIAIAFASIPVYARVVRITTLQVRGAAFVEAAVALGQRRTAIVVKHVLPNVIGPLLVLATIGIGTAIVAGSGLSFLGLGPASPTPEWGLLLSEGRNTLGIAWWTAVFPGVAITATVISTTVLGRALQNRFAGWTR